MVALLCRQGYETARRSPLGTAETPRLGVGRAEIGVRHSFSEIEFARNLKLVLCWSGVQGETDDVFCSEPST